MRTRSARSFIAALVWLALGASAARAAAAPGSIAHEGLLTLTSRTPTGQGGHWFVAFEEEINKLPGSAGFVGGSLSGAAEVDCAAAQFKVAKLSLFTGPNLTGALLLEVTAKSVWDTAKPGTTMDRVMAAACAKTRGLAKVEAKARAAAAPPPEFGFPAHPPAKPPAASGPPARAPVAATSAKTVALAIAPPVSPPPAAASAAASASGPAFYAQLASLGSADAARQAWDQLKVAAPGILDDRRRRLTTATVHGRRVYRVLAGGFGTKAEAETVCKALARLAVRCFVRPGDAT
jgi:hypothetical protein